MFADPNKAKAIFLQAVEAHVPERWPAFLEAACGGDADLRARVEELLSAHQAVKSVKLDAVEPAVARAATIDEFLHHIWPAKVSAARCSLPIS